MVRLPARLYPTVLPLLLLLVIFACVSDCLSLKDSNSSAYEILESYGFPAGLLPQMVTDYNLQDDGTFSLSLNGSCAVDIPDAYPVKYASTISGTINVNSLSSLNGITVKVFFLWWGIDSISVSGDDLVFKVGPASASYPIPNFDENPVCEDSSSVSLGLKALQ